LSISGRQETGVNGDRTIALRQGVAFTKQFSKSRTFKVIYRDDRQFHDDQAGRACVIFATKAQNRCGIMKSG
ncbi:MAG: hypothetical protein AAF067_06745, partial [Pseudomonadota bacterium]